MKYVVTIEYKDKTETKLVLPNWGSVRAWLDTRLDAPVNARQVKRVTICPRDL